ncbi:hypothetical protein OHA70_02995 [Kribbella sp. NBC_00382]|uniref:hypothetical protein n=1 Tax=Kribbella sp. NBC_00382 TaxID=2975967 RepID=UPI002E22A341
MSDQSNQSDYDRRVRTILDRVAAGHLTTEEAATLIAALPTNSTATNSTAPTSTAPADSAASADSAPSDSAPADRSFAGSADSAPAGSPAPADAAAADDSPSPSVWAEVVDTPAPNGSPKHAAAASEGQGSVVDDAAVVPEPAPAVEPEPAAAPAAPAPAAEPAAAAEPVHAPTAEPVVEEETLHSDLVVPSGVRRVTIRAIGRRVRLIGEPAVTGVAVDGPHVIKRDGDTLAINSEGDMGVSIDGLSMLRNPTDLKSHVNGFAKELSIRVNPMLQVEIEVTGGSVHAERLPGLSRVRVTAGTAKVTDVDGPIDLLVQAGTATLDAQITKGRSRVRVESGSANVTLRRGSDVRVHTEAQLGRVSWTGAVSGQSKDVEIGRGRAALDVEVLVGSAQITSD